MLSEGPSASQPLLQLECSWGMRLALAAGALAETEVPARGMVSSGLKQSTNRVYWHPWHPWTRILNIYQLARSEAWWNLKANRVKVIAGRKAPHDTRTEDTHQYKGKDQTFIEEQDCNIRTLKPFWLVVSTQSNQCQSGCTAKHLRTTFSFWLFNILLIIMRNHDTSMRYLYIYSTIVQINTVRSFFFHVFYVIIFANPKSSFCGFTTTAGGSARLAEAVAAISGVGSGSRGAADFSGSFGSFAFGLGWVRSGPG